MVRHFQVLQSTHGHRDARPSQFAPVLIAPTHGGVAGLSWPEWLVARRDGGPCRSIIAAGGDQLAAAASNRLSERRYHGHVQKVRHLKQQKSRT